jgi:AcrR family transcriptional regulator
VPRVTERTPEPRERILAAALDVLETEGVSALTARRAASSAATPVPAVYELFGDKAGSVRELFFEGLGTSNGTTVSWSRPTTSSPT